MIGTWVDRKTLPTLHEVTAHFWRLNLDTILDVIESLIIVLAGEPVYQMLLKIAVDSEASFVRGSLA